MVVVLALLSSLSWGVADFNGGLAAKKLPAPVVTFWSAAAELVVVSAALIVGPVMFRVSDVGVGLLAGLVGFSTLAFFYKAMGSGQVSVVAPVTGAVGALVPFAWGVMAGERPTAVQLAGVGVAVVSIALVSSQTPSRQNRFGFSDCVKGIVSGTGFGVYFVLLEAMSDNAGATPLLWVTLTGLVGSAAICTFRSLSPRGPLRSISFAASTGVLNLSASFCFILAARDGNLALAGVLSSTYPAITVLLSWLILHESLSRLRRAGVIVAVAGVALIATG